MATGPISLFKQWISYITASGSKKLDSMADPLIQLEQARAGLDAQVRQVREAAATVIAGANMAKTKLESGVEEVEKLNLHIQMAMKEAETAREAGDIVKAEEYDAAARTLTGKLLGVEQRVEILREQFGKMDLAQQQARAQAAQVAEARDAKLAEIEAAKATLDTAKMTEATQQALEGLGALTADGASSVDAVIAKIAQRAAEAEARSTLMSTPADSALQSVEALARSSAVEARMAEISSQVRPAAIVDTA